jgi:hypothetical protein
MPSVARRKFIIAFRPWPLPFADGSGSAKSGKSFGVVVTAGRI